MEFEKLLGSLGSAMQNAYRGIEQHNFNEFLRDYFEFSEKGGENNDGEEYISPKVFRISMPGGNGSETIEVPYLALAHHQSMNIEEVKVKLNVNAMEEGERINIAMCGAPGETGSSADVNEIELTFKRVDTAEGIARIHQTANKYL